MRDEADVAVALNNTLQVQLSLSLALSLSLSVSEERERARARMWLAGARGGRREEVCNKAGFVGRFRNLAFVALFCHAVRAF